VEGMSCSACSSAVERVVKRIDGVKSAEVNLVAKLLQCEYDGEKVVDADIIKAVEKAGFSATLIQEKKESFASLLYIINSFVLSFQ
jgi:Cu+-exporting ATPase